MAANEANDRGRTFTGPIAVTMLSLHAVLLAWSAARHSPVFHETPHLPAGISHWTFGRFDLYCVNPPLVRLVAALPVMVAGYRTNWGNYVAETGHRPELQVGRDFIWANGSRSFQLFKLSRWMCIPFSLVGGWACYQWAKQLYGSMAALFALTMWCVCPNVIGHGQLIMPDLAAASLGVAAAFCCWRWLNCFKWTSALTAGCILGLTLLTKTTWIILLPLWPALWLMWFFTSRKPHLGWRSLVRQVSQLALILAAALCVLNAGYGFSGTGKQLCEFRFVSRLLTSSANDPEGGNRFQKHWWGELPVPLPAAYVVGIDLQQRDFEHFNDLSYLRGEWQEGGWWYFYLYALAVKVPLGTWVLLFMAIATSFVRKQKSGKWRDELLLLTPAVTLLVMVSIQLEFNHHLRYVLPAFPFVFIWIARLVPVVMQYRIWAGAAVSALTWTTISSLMIYPHSLSYFNELAGGPKQGPEHLLHSNMDWGQDLLYLRKWILAHPQASPLSVKYYGGFDLHAVDITYPEPPACATTVMGCGLQPGWYAVSVNLVRGMPWRGVLPESYSYFRPFQPVASAGYSILIYYISEEDIRSSAAQLRPDAE